MLSSNCIMREKGGSRWGTGEVGKRFCSQVRGKSTTPQGPIPLYPYFLLNSQACFTPRDPRTIPRLLSESSESLRELHRDYRDKKCFCVNQPCAAYCQHSGGTAYCECCCSWWWLLLLRTTHQYTRQKLLGQERPRLPNASPSYKW